MRERGGRTTRSFDQWSRAERQLRSFLRFGLRFGDEGLERLWKEIEGQTSDGSEDTIDVFDRKLEGLGSHEFGWMLAAATVRDAVTLYEVYLEQAAGEILVRHGLEWGSDESPRWPELREFFRFVGIDLYEDKSVEKVRRLRHLLTHRRGALETEADRASYGSAYPFPYYEAVELDEPRVLVAMDALAISVRRIDADAYDYSWGEKRVELLQEMRAALPDDDDGPQGAG
jgi:hypothetical protein